jgi:hypothetical protein
MTTFLRSGALLLNVPAFSFSSVSSHIRHRMLGSSFLRAVPGPGEVHLWLLDPSKVDDPAILEVYSTFLNDGEKKIIQQGATELARKERLLTRVLARTTLARCKSANAHSSVFVWILAADSTTWLI